MAMSVNPEVRQEVWEKQYFKGADVQGDQVLDFDDVKRLCLRLNVNLTIQELAKLFKVRAWKMTLFQFSLTIILIKEADTENRGYLDYAQYQKFVRILQRRPDIEEIYENICTTYGGKLDFEGFVKFMEKSQKVFLSPSYPLNCLIDCLHSLG